MPSQALVIDGVLYVRSKDAARLVNLAPDYVSRLAREGLIIGRQVERAWVVNLRSLHVFIAEQERQKEIWRAALAQKRREEQRLAGHPASMPAVLT